jgi:hypothetical protein
MGNEAGRHTRRSLVLAAVAPEGSSDKHVREKVVDSAYGEQKDEKKEIRDESEEQEKCSEEEAGA